MKSNLQKIINWFKTNRMPMASSILLLAITVLYQNCNNETHFFGKMKDTKMVVPPIVIIENPPNERPPVEPPDVPTTPEEVAMACAEAAAKGLLLEEEHDVDFAPASDCSWGEDGNSTLNAAKQCVFGAKKEMEETILIAPQAKRICDIKIDIQNKEQRYDDEMLFVLNDVVLVSSQDFSSSKIDSLSHRLVKDENGLVIYDWSKIFQSPYYKNVSACIYEGHNSKKFIVNYCLGYEYNTSEFAANCLVPPTEITGKMSINLPEQAIHLLSSKIGLEMDKAFEQGKAKELKFKLITLGDDDAGDCAHRGLIANVKIKYID